MVRLGRAEIPAEVAQHVRLMIGMEAREAHYESALQHRQGAGDRLLRVA